MSIQINNQQSAIGNRQSERGFSLTEVLLAVGILAVGMLFIASAFPVSIYFTTVATERTIAPVVADEAFAKFKLYWPDVNSISEAELAYPSTPTDPNSKRYWWAYLRTNPNPNTNDVNVVIFVFRKTGVSSRYWVRTSNTDATLAWISHPSLIYVSVSASPSGRPDELMINDLAADTINETSFINDGYTIMDDATGRIYRVLERYYAYPNVIRLDKDWIGSYSSVWVASPPAIVGPPPGIGGRYPCIGVYQKIMHF